MILEENKLSSLCFKITDGTHDSPKSVSNGFPYIKGTQVKNGLIDFDNCEYLDEEDHLKVISRSKPEKGDVLFANIGANIGECAYVNVDFEFSIKNVALFKPNSEYLNGKFLYYLLSSDLIQRDIKNRKSGSAQPFLSLNLLRNYIITYPPIQIQKRIANILTSYDDLIENNLKRIKLLEQAAQNIYKEWFVNMRFPGYESVEFDSGTGLPVDWKITSLNELATYFGRGITPKYEEGSGLLGINQKVNKGYLLEPQFMKEFDSGMDIPDSKYSQFGDVLINSLGEGTIGRIHFYSGKSFIHPVDQHISIFRAKNLGLSLYSYLFFSSDKGQGLLSSIKKGGTNMTMLNIGDLRKLEIIIPDNQLLCNLEDTILVFYKKINVLVEQNQNLKSARDILLPRLMNQTIEV